MEQGRVFIAIVLSLLVFVVWDFFFVDRTATVPPPQAQDQQSATAAPDQAAAPGTPATQAFESTTTALSSTAEPSPTAGETRRVIVVKTPLYTADLSELGGNITGFALMNYRETIEKDSPFKQLISEKNPLGSARLDLPGINMSGINYQVNIESDQITIRDKGEAITFTGHMPDGVIVEKTFLFSPDTYLIDLVVTIKNASDHPIAVGPAVSLVHYESPDLTAGYGFTGPSGYINGKLEEVKKKKIAELGGVTGNISWVAILEQYFVTSIIPVNHENMTMKLALKDSNFIHNQLVSPSLTLNPNSENTFKYQLFFGPKSLKILKSFDNDLAELIYFGWFDILAKPCLWLMNFFHANLIANYGIAIILLTLLIKILLWPLGQKSYKSMNEMKKLQPLTAEIKEKYKNDKKKMNEETMALYRAYKVNPMGGCLPMVVQIPVFFGLYRMLYGAIELRHAPFFGWISDLSAPDRLFEFSFSIPFMLAPYGIPVLTLVMGATMFLQQKLQPAMGDAMQAKMMMMMPIFFTFIFINFPSGLVLYWLVNNVFSIAQQHFTRSTAK